VKESAHVENQRRFYDSGSHDHLQVAADDLYSQKIAARTAEQLELRGNESVLEVGAGFGRFTFPLLEHCAKLLAVDLTPRSLEELATTRDSFGIDAARCRTLCSDVNTLGSADGERFDAIVGFFFLHHLSDYAESIARLAPLLRPGGRMAFIEPNRWNPLFAVQLTTCADMNWRDEKGLYSLTPQRVEAALGAAGLEDLRTARFGFFPPQLHNRSSTARRVEASCENANWLRWLLPFHLVSARAPEGRRP